MGWKRGRFGGADVWVEVDASGAPRAAGGRVPIRYQAFEGARVYRATAANVTLDAAGEVQDLPSGTSADAAKAAAKPAAKGKKGKGSGFGSAGTRTAEQAALAAGAARELLASLPAGTIVAYADGSAKGNPGPAGSGAVVELPDGRSGECSRSLGRATNNIAELTAVACVIELLDEAGVPDDAPVALLTDSKYAVGVLSLGWKANANRELVEDIRESLQRRSGVEMHWIAGHVGTPGNERADTLANDGVTGKSAIRWRTA